MERFFKHHLLGVLGSIVVALFALLAIYAPFLASSKPIAVEFEGSWYFPLFRYLFYSGFYTKPLDLFFNLMIFTLPLGLLFHSKRGLLFVALIQILAFTYLEVEGIKNPTYDAKLVSESLKHPMKTQEEEELYKNDYGKLNDALMADPRDPRIGFILMPPISHFHWEDDAGGASNKPSLLRINGRDLISALLFGTRISLVVGLLTCALALAIGLPIGAYAGYYGGRLDLIVCRLIEIWESMPAFFMLLFAVAILQSKSIFIVITLIALFGWTGFCRYIRGETLKQRSLAYVEACKAIGYSDRSILFTQIFPNAIAPVITLLPFAIMGAISSEAGLSFLGLGEEGSTSWGVLMDEGRNAFPARSYLLWPPALMLTTLLVAIALVGDALRDYLDPRN